MNTALYYPFSRCLDETTLKRAVLMFDELLFVDPVDPAARSALYLREGAMSGANQSLAAKWLAAEQNYDLLSQRGIVRTVDSTVLTIPDAADALVAGGLALDIDVNDSSTALFAGKRRWHMLEARLPASALETRFRPRRGPDSWTGEPVVEVPFAVGASVTLTYALAIAHELCATPFTDNRAQDALLKLRLKSAQMVQQQLPGVYMSSQQPYLRGLVELEVARTIATDAQLRRVSLAEILSYRDSNEPARLELTDLIGQLSLEAQHRPWDSRLDSDLSRISNKAQKIAEGLPGPHSAWMAAQNSMSRPSLKATLGARVAISAFVAPHLPLLAGLGAGALAVAGAAKDAVLAGVDELRRVRSPEENAIAYLHQAGRSR